MNKAAQRLSVRSFRQIRGETKYGRILIWGEERGEDSRDTYGLAHLYMCMDHLKMTSHVFLYDSVASDDRPLMIMIMETVRTTIRRFASHFDRS